jgi:hypothetical protein
MEKGGISEMYLDLCEEYANDFDSYIRWFRNEKKKPKYDKEDWLMPKKV